MTEILLGLIFVALVVLILILRGSLGRISNLLWHAKNNTGAQTEALRQLDESLTNGLGSANGHLIDISTNMPKQPKDEPKEWVG